MVHSSLDHSGRDSSSSSNERPPMRRRLACTDWVGRWRGVHTSDALDPWRVVVVVFVIVVQVVALAKFNLPTDAARTNKTTATSAAECG